MSGEKRFVPVYQRLAASGFVREQLAGVEVSLKPGDDAAAAAATWLVTADTLGGLVPRRGDRLRGTDGAWFQILQVGPPADGRFPCDCGRLPSKPEGGA